MTEGNLRIHAAMRDAAVFECQRISDSGHYRLLLWLRRRWLAVFCGEYGVTRQDRAAEGIHRRRALSLDDHAGMLERSFGVAARIVRVGVAARGECAHDQQHRATANSSQLPVQQCLQVPMIPTQEIMGESRVRKAPKLLLDSPALAVSIQLNSQNKTS